MKYASILLLTFAILGALRADAADEPPPNTYGVNLFGWSYGRERKTITSSNRVTGTFSAKNVLPDAISDLVVTITYKEGSGAAVHDPVSTKVGSMKAGELKKISIVGDFVPVFNGYAVLVEYTGKKGKVKEEWYANSDVGQPQARSGELIEGMACVNILGKECGTDRTGIFKGTIRVFNEGMIEAQNCKLTAIFYDDNKKVLKEWTGPLGTGKVAGGAEQSVAFTVPGAPKLYKSYELKVKFDDTSAETQLSGGDFSNRAEVEVAKFDFKRKDGTSPDLQVKAQVRNGLNVEAEEVKVTVIFRNAKNVELKRFTHKVPGKMKAGEVKPIEFTVAGLPSYESFENKIDFKSGGPTAGSTPSAAKSETKIGGAKFQKIKDLEIIFTDAVTNDDKSVSLAGSLRNGRNHPVKDVVIEVLFTLGNGSTTKAVKTLSEPIQPGEERNFVVKGAGAAGFAEYGFTFKYASLPAAEKDPAAGALDALSKGL